MDADEVVVNPSSVTLKQAESIKWTAVGASMVVNVEDDIFTQPVNNITIPSGGSLTLQLKSKAPKGTHNYSVSSGGHQPESLPKMIID